MKPCVLPASAPAVQLELSTIVARYGQQVVARYGSWMTWWHILALKSVALCRTAVLGWHHYRCDRCGHEAVIYNSCQNRHCNKCQARERRQWLEARMQDLLPVEYFHVVFTLPQQLAELAQLNRQVMYDLLFRAVSETLQELAADPKRLGGKIGFIAVLHTWGQLLTHHPHLHCIVPGGAVSPCGKRWISCARGFFLPIPVMREKFKPKYLSLLKQAHDAGELKLGGKFKSLADTNNFHRWLSPLYDLNWVVHPKPSCNQPARVLAYLARYTHRVAISNQRLVKLENDEVTFRYKDYRRGHRWKQTTLPAIEFLRRWLNHVLPRNYMRIRYYGFLANPLRKRMMTLIRQLIEKQPAQDITLDGEQKTDNWFGDDDLSCDRCPKCKQGRFQAIAVRRPHFLNRRLLDAAWVPDT